MKRKLALTWLGLGCLLASTSTFAISQHVFEIGPSAEYELAVNDPVVLSNMFMWSVNAQCTIISKEETNYLAFKALQKSGTVNGTRLSKGESMTLILHPRDVIHITAISGAKVELLNTGTNPITARCSTG